MELIPDGSPSASKPRRFSFSQAQALGSTAPASKIHHYYAGRSNKDELRFANYADSAKRFSAKLAVESLGEHTGGHCPFCGDRLFEKNGEGSWKDVAAFEWDHLLPASRLGLTVDGNICPICSDCNQSKSDKDALAYYEERRLQGLPTFFARKRDLKRFLKSFSKPYRAVYGKKLYDQARNNSRNGATEHELRVQAAELLTAMDKNGEYVLTMAVKVNERQHTSSAPFIEKFKAEEIAHYDSQLYRSTLNRALHKIQYAIDSMFEEGIIETPDLETMELEEFEELARRTFASVACLSSTEKRHGEVKRLLAMLALRSPYSSVREAATRLATHAVYRDQQIVLTQRSSSQSMSI